MNVLSKAMALSASFALTGCIATDQSGVGKRFRDCRECPELVVVPAGSYLMGSPPHEQGRVEDEEPFRQVWIGEPFAVGVYEVTVSEFSHFVNETGHSTVDECSAHDEKSEYLYHEEGDLLSYEEFDGEFVFTFYKDGKTAAYTQREIVSEEAGVFVIYQPGEATEWWVSRRGRGWRDPGFRQEDSHPVVCVSWDDARAYVSWLSRRTGERYRLLSESEWEYAARAGTRTARYWGDGESGQCRYANGADASTGFDWAIGCDDRHSRTAPVGSYGANAWGLHDVLGNVWEWTADCWHFNYQGAPSDGSAWDSADCKWRVVRGGAWFSQPKDLRSADRYREDSFFGHKSRRVGFRVARTLTP